MKKKKKIIILGMVFTVLMVPLLYFGIEREIPFTYIGESDCELDTSYLSHYDAPVEILVCENIEETLAHQKRLGFAFPFEIDYEKTYVIIAYGRRVEIIHYRPTNLNITNSKKDLLITFSYEYYPDEVHFYLIEKNQYGSGYTGDPYATCYILSKKGTRFRAGTYEDISSSSYVQEVLGEKK